MFDAAFGIFGGVSQILMLLMGLIFFGIGGMMLIYPFWQWVAWVRVKARIVEVRARTAPSREAEQEPQNNLPVTSFSEEFRKSPGTGMLAMLVVLLVVGVPLLFVGIGAYFALDYAYLTMNGMETQGRITGFQEGENDDGSASYAPVVTFRDHQGVERTLTYRIGSSNRKGLAEGQGIRVFYEQDKPAHFVIDHFWYNMLLPVGFMAMGGLFLFIMFFRGMRRRPVSRKDKKKELATSNIYYPTYEYVTPDGRLVRAEGDSGSSMLGDKIPGSEVTVYLKEDDFEAPSQPSFLLSAFGLLFAAPGVFIMSLAIGQIDFSIYTLIAGMGVLGFLAYKIAKNIKPRSAWDNRESFRARMKAKRVKKREGSVLLTQAEFHALLQQHDRTVLTWVPVYMLITLAMMVGGLYLYNHQKAFQAGAAAAKGEVVRIISRSDSDGTMYYPVISFRTPDRQLFEFQDNFGSNPPSYRRSDIVKVLYPPESPREAIIDRGWLNQLPGAGLMIAGGVLFFLSLRSYMRSRIRLTSLR